MGSLTRSPGPAVKGGPRRGGNRARRCAVAASLACLSSLASCSDAPSEAPALVALYAFDGADGAWSRGSLVRAGRTLYGRTSIGGAANSGTIFGLDQSGADFALLYSFTAGGDNVFGNQPHHNAMLLEGGTLLGAALYGGNTDDGTSPHSERPPIVQTGNGTLFAFDPSIGSYTVLAPFDGGTGNPAVPHSPPVRAPDGTLYGMTAAGGKSGGGTLYAIPPGGALRILHDFAAPEGNEPHGMVVLDSHGTRLLGMTRHGGTPICAIPPCGKGAGVIFAFDLVTGRYEVLHTFVARDPSNGETNDHGFLTLADGFAWGVTSLGGANLEGTLFRIREDGSEFALAHSFGDGPEDGTEPFGSLVPLGAYLYGTTTLGGARGDGTLFRFRPSDGHYEVLASFDRRTTGAFPEDNVVASEDGSILYGLTQAGGENDPEATLYYGTVFAFPVPESP